MSYFEDYPARTGDRPLFKMEHYLGIYDDILASWQGREVSFLEIGVYKGGSIPMWQEFFAPASRLVFLDIDPACAALALPGTTVGIGDQADPAFLDRIARTHGPFDLIVDDGDHMMDQQIASFRHLWPQLNDRGLYIVEDTHTSYWPGFGGGFRTPESFIEFAKDLIDRMHSWYTEDDAGFPLHPLAREIGAIRFYDSLVVIEKRLKDPPVSIVAANGQTLRSREILEIRGRRSIFGAAPKAAASAANAESPHPPAQQGPSQLTQVATQGALRLLENELPSVGRLNAALRHLAKWRSTMLDNTIRTKTGNLVQGGPFRGMNYAVRAAEGAAAARLLGAYEASLFPVIEEIVARACPQVIDIGCAEGYYAVGLARRMPGATVLARDASPHAQRLCAKLAAINGVADRVQVGGLFTHADFALCRQAPTVVICDIEGDEETLLDPAAAPDLLFADILVEVHERVHPGLTDRLTTRFAASHRITRLDHVLAPDLLPDWAAGISDLDRLLLLWEWRSAPTPWLWMERK